MESDETAWTGPWRRAPRGGVVDVDECVKRLLEALGPGKTVRAEAKELSDSGHLGAAIRGEIDSLPWPEEGRAWAFEVQLRRAWSLAQSMYASGAVPSFATGVHRLFEGVGDEAGELWGKTLRLPNPPDAEGVQRGFEAMGLGDAVVAAMLATLIDSMVDELAYVLEGWDRDSVWVLVYPGVAVVG